MSKRPELRKAVTMDVLSDVLRLLRLRASVFLHSDFCGTWTVDSSGSGKATFHLVAHGNCWLHLPGAHQPQALAAGDLVVFPRDARHIISGSTAPLPDETPPGIVTSGGEGASTSLICGYFEFDSPQVNPLLDALPDAVHIRSEQADNAIWLDTLVRLISLETEVDSPGAEAIVDKLSDVLFVQVVRTYMRENGPPQGLLAALSDTQIYRALQAVHLSPGSAWSVEILAMEAGMSRSAFARRFQQLMNITPMHYVAGWRMQRAYDVLAEGRQSVAAVAETFGYQSEASFSKAFKQHVGVGPGAVRKSAR